VHTVKAAIEEAMLTVGHVDAHVIVAHVLGVNRAYLMANPMRILTETEDAIIDVMVAQRAMGRPVAYLTETREFYGREFSVDGTVLIPRPETEGLVEAALERMDKKASIVDLGTGSGAIAVTIACERPLATITATDASAAALATAKRNARRQGCDQRIDFREGSWYEPLAGRRFDVIVSNPPYVAAGDPHLGAGDLRFEPPHALTDGGADGLDSIRAVITGASGHLNSGGWLLLEHGYDQAEAVRLLLEAAGFAGLVSIPDLAGIPRVAGGKIR
jgi:release factor glutamine methyltransferase